MLADNALTTTDKIRLSIDATEKEMLINAASDIIETYCNREFAKDTGIVELKEGTESEYLPLKKYPILNVTSITYDDGVEEITSYTVLQEEGVIYRPEGWNFEKYDLEVTYDGGYVLPKDDGSPNPRTLPQGIEHAAIMLASHLHHQQDADFRVQRKSNADMSESYFENAEAKLPGTVRALLSPYRVIPI
jgi:hypothetical protein